MKTCMMMDAGFAAGIAAAAAADIANYTLQVAS
jgi:hypothetical protein